MIDYSKLQIEIVKNYLRKGSLTNKFCYTDDGIILTDSDGTTAILIPKDKFILDTSKFVSNELKSLKDLIKDDVTQCVDNGLEKYIKPGLTAHIFTYDNKEFLVDRKRLRIIGYDKSIYTVKTDISKKYPLLQFYIDDRFVGMICPIKP